MTPAVSVVVATYNYGRFLAQALDSVFGQTVADLEVVVVDDGSSDDTPEVMRPYLADPRARYVRIEHAGQGVAKNRSVRLARAPLVAFLDADDLWLPAKLEKQLALFRADPGLGVVFTRRLLIDEAGRELPYRQPVLHRGWVAEEIFQRNFVCFSSAMARRDVLDEAGLFDESLPLAIDYDLWLRVALRHRFDYVDEPLVKYRTGHASLSRRFAERQATVAGIQRRFLEERGGRAVVRPAVRRRARAEVCCNLGLAWRQRSRLRALRWYGQALASSPGLLLAWRGLASLPLPELVRRWFRRALGKRPDWTVCNPLA
jgi:glycosyltransferase involved in cell wall biosynthesis